MNTVEKILKLIKKNNITAYKLTSDLKLSNSAITEWKKGKANPSVKVLIKIAEYFGLSLNYFYQESKLLEFLYENGITENDIENLTQEQLSVIAETIKNFNR